MNKRERETKAKLRLDISQHLLIVSFTIFGLMISLESSLLAEYIVIPLQLTMAIPLILTSIFSKLKLAFSKNYNLWNTFGYYTFTFAYAFLINVIGILLSIKIGLIYAIIFFTFNISLTILYSIIDMKADNSTLDERIRKDLLFAIIIFVGGILPSLGVY
jgi:hypothetical protein